MNFLDPSESAFSASRWGCLMPGWKLGPQRVGVLGLSLGLSNA